MKNPVNIFWFRRDLRLTDNAGLYHALKSDHPVLPIFIFDTNILNDLEEKKDRRVNFIYDVLKDMQDKLVEQKSSLWVYYGTPEDAFKQLTKDFTIVKVFTNNDYEPYARERDEKIAGFLKKSDIGFHSYKDQVIFEKDEVVKDDGKPYTVFTPYSRKWKDKLNDFYLDTYPALKYYDNFFETKPYEIPALQRMGFEESEKGYPGKSIKEDILKDYNKTRDYPGIRGTSRLGMHFRFGTISIRHAASKAKGISPTYLNELIWRDFYQMILWHFPHVGKGKSFKPEYDNIKWRYNEKDFKRWCEGTTGYPIVDAGMREINATGFMHNRVRMITASFLSKHLLLDWRMGEAYFAEKLLDYDLASNNGGWQWAAGCGCDAAPYFRVFNPYLQTKKFDPDLAYIKKWVPEFEQPGYPEPMVDHKEARERALKVYAAAVKKNK